MKGIKSITIIMLIIANVILFFFIIYKQNSTKEEYALKTSGIYYDQIRVLEYSSESKNYTPLFFIGKDTLTPIDYSNKLPALICVFSIESCAPCYKTMLETVASIFPDYKDREDIIFLSNDLEFRYRNSFYEKKVFSNVIKSQLPIDQVGVPYFFILEKDLKTNLLIHSEKDNYDIVKKHLDIIKEHLICDSKTTEY